MIWRVRPVSTGIEPGTDLARWGASKTKLRRRYALVGLRPTVSAFLAHARAIAAATLAAESLVLAVGAAAPDAKTAVVICPVVLSTSLLFGGLFVSLDSLPAVLAPLQYLSLFRYAFAALLKAEFDHADAIFACSDADRAARRPGNPEKTRRGFSDFGGLSLGRIPA